LAGRLDREWNEHNPDAERDLQPHEVRVALHAAGLNFRDVMLTLGLVDDDAIRELFTGDVEDLLATHHRLIGPRRDVDTLPSDQHVVSATHTDRQTTVLVRTEAPILDPAWTVGQLTLEDVILAYMSNPVAARPALEVLR